MRSWGRFALFAAFGVSVLAGEGLIVGIDKAREDFTRKPDAASLYGRLLPLIWLLLFGGLALTEFYTGPQALINTGPRGVDRWLAAQEERGTLIQMPLAAALSGPQMYYSMFNGQRMAGGYGTYFPIIFEARYPELQEFPADSALDLLEKWGEGSGGEVGIDYILIDEADIPLDDPLWQQIAGQDRLHHLVTIDGVSVYTVQ
jgi:hypothetical protein